MQNSKYLLSETLRILEKHKVLLSKRRGQRFLIDPKVIMRQINYADVNKKDTVLEIGCGIGNLTYFLAEKAGKIIGIEIDRRFYSILKDRLSCFNNVEIILGDALKIEFPEVDKIVSNIPYDISSPLTFKILKSKFKLAVLMYQLEFAKRMVATVGSSDYSRLTVGVSLKAKCEILEKVSKNAFYPPPKIDSALVKIEPRKPKFKIKHEELLFEVLRGLFAYKNKKVRNALKIYLSQQGIEDAVKEEIMRNIPFLELKVRKLTPQQFVELSEHLHKFLKK
ncbi:MAG: 16S rRNA (adenine(1518)-N(6)/adenine(1519)-N(6))-dimethyltransferase RsmA [Candidatus Odinarchaeia archaeon]